MISKLPKLRQWLYDLPVSRKILAITLASSFSTLFLISAISFVHERNSFYESKINTLESLARILESNTAAALRFNDNYIATQYVESFQEEPDIESVCIYDAAGEPFALFARDEEFEPFPAPADLGAVRQTERLFYSSDVSTGDEKLGSILIEVNTRSIHSATMRLLWSNVAVLIGGIALSILLATNLRKMITRPINELVEVTRKIAKEKDYTVKAERRNSDEIGLLVDSVNEMLEAIRLRDDSLQSINANLEKTVERRTRDLNERNKALNRAIEAVKKAAQAKGEFLATTSHELRTPLNPIIGYVDRLLEKTKDLESVRELEIIKQSAELLLRLIDDILDFSRVERGEIRLLEDEINLQKCCSDVIYLMRTEAQAKGLGLEFGFEAPEDFDKDKAIYFISDEGRLRQVVLNLIGNALKFTDSGKITIQAGIHKGDNPPNGALKIRIEDTGMGIDEKDIESLFRPFTQVDGGLNRRHGGLGLGLAISKAFVEALGGSIHCSSVLGEGSAFWFEIPIKLLEQRDTPASTLQPAEPPEAIRGRQAILLVDDERVNRELGASMMRSLGYSVVCAKNGFEALEQTGKQSFDLILMDIRMPRMDGYETAAAIREREIKSPPTPIVALSAHITPADEKRCLEVGMTAYLQKPLNMDTLHRSLSNWLRKRPEHNDQARA